MEIARTKNTIINFVWGLLNKVTTIVFPFIIRTVIIYVLGVKYTGLNGLFTSVLSVLSLAELGVGSVLSYSMYKPIANNDTNKICALLNLYRKVYLVIGAVVLLIGVILLPFIPFFVNDTIPDELNIYLLYLIYLSESVCSYFLFAYRSSLYNAFHRKHVISNISTVVNLAVYILQILGIFLFKNYYFYLILRPISVAIINFVTYLWSKHDYPDIECEGKLSSEEIKDIKKQVGGLMCQRLAFKSRNAFDSIVISSFLGLVVVGIYSNYFYIIGAIDLILELIFQSMQSGIGNSVASETIEKNYKDFRKINFLYLWISGVCTVCLLILFQDFMSMWVGNELRFPFQYVMLFCLLFLCTRFTDAEGAYISGTGTWWYCRRIYIFEAVLNLILNVLLGYFWGVPGVILASIITVIFINFILCGKVLFKYYFKNYSFKSLIIEDLKLFASIIVACVISYFLTIGIPSSDSMVIRILFWILKAIICFTASNGVFLILFFRNQSFKDCVIWLKKYFRYARRKK